MDILTSIERWPLKEPFSISRHTFLDSLVVTATITDVGGRVGIGECEPHGWEDNVALRQMDAAGCVAGRSSSPAWLQSATRDNIVDRLPRNPLRNGIDCALWDLEAKTRGLRAHELAGTTSAPIPIMPTLGLNPPEVMGKRAAGLAGAAWVKVKLGAKDGLDVQRLEAVSAALPGVSILVDPNGGWNRDTLVAMMPICQRLGVRIIEQPMVPELNNQMPKPIGDIRFFADESCLDRASLPAVREHFQGVNIKLDKSGGLTESLALRCAAESQGLGVMVGMMSGTSLAVAPAFVLAQGLEVVDLEVGYMTRDREPPMVIDNFRLQPPAAALWG